MATKKNNSTGVGSGGGGGGEGARAPIMFTECIQKQYTIIFSVCIHQQ